MNKRKFKINDSVYVKSIASKRFFVGFIDKISDRFITIFDVDKGKSVIFIRKDIEMRFL